MSETTLLIAFVAFVFIMIIAGMVARKMSVRDIFDESSVSLKGSPAVQRDAFPSSTNMSASGSAFSAKEKKKTVSGSENLGKVGKALSIIGIALLFLPTPEGFKIAGMVMAFLGSMIAKATTPKKKEASAKVNPVAQKIRLLASKPEYQDALKLLSTDYQKEALVTEEDKYKRAVQYLESKGVPREEAKKNLKLLRTLLVQQRK